MTTENRLTDVRATFLPRQVCRRTAFWSSPSRKGGAERRMNSAPDQVLAG